jgi:hypothetical protein
MYLKCFDMKMRHFAPWYYIKLSQNLSNVQMLVKKELNLMKDGKC